MNIKLCINSIYGKMAQKIGGHRGEPPVCANPYYAAAITSWCRRKLMEACLKDPEAIVMMATDGTISTRPLDLDIGKGLGQWECSEATGGLFLQSGVYFYLKNDEEEEDKRIVNRLRGSSKKSIGGKALRDEIIAGALFGWSTPPNEFPEGIMSIIRFKGGNLQSLSNKNLASRLETPCATRLGIGFVAGSRSKPGC